MFFRKLDGNGRVATDTKDRPAAAGSKEKKHKASDVHETAGREGDGEDGQSKKKQETKARAKGKNSKRSVVVTGKGNSGKKGKVIAPQPPSPSPPPALKGGSGIVYLVTQEDAAPRTDIFPTIHIICTRYILLCKI